LNKALELGALVLFAHTLIFERHAVANRSQAFPRRVAGPVLHEGMRRPDGHL
jgi:hypothetical protein